nr:ORF6N domain-containing protein [Saprospiraceae bacterium]
EKVMLDQDLAELYDVETSYLKRQVRRNIDRFPEDFMFELTSEEFENLRSQNGTSSWGGTRYTPMAFTEQGVAQLSSVLNSGRAIQVNIQIIRLFTKMRNLLLSHHELFLKIEKMKHLLTNHDQDIAILFDYLKKLLNEDKQKKGQEDRKRIGYKKDEE